MYVYLLQQFRLYIYDKFSTNCQLYEIIIIMINQSIFSNKLK